MPNTDPDKRRACGRVASRRWRATHPDEARASSRNSQRRWRDAHREKKAARDRAYYIANRDRIKAAGRVRKRKWRLANLEKIAAAARAYRKQKPDIVHAIAARNKARRRGAAGSHTLAEWREKCALLGNVCIYCGLPGRLERDHKVPISRGGTDDIENIVPCCHSCNSKKRTLTAREFIARRLARQTA